MNGPWMPHPAPEQDTAPEETVATLVDPADHVRHIGQVAAVTTRDLVLLKRKFASRAGYELVRYPIAACARVKHVDERPVATLVSGLLLTALVVGIAVLLVTTWKELDPGTRVPVGALGIAGVYGFRRLFGARRHRLIFTLQDGARLEWRSRPGDYALRRGAAERVVELARSRDILEAGRLVRG